MTNNTASDFGNINSTILTFITYTNIPLRNLADSNCGGK